MTKDLQKPEKTEIHKLTPAEAKKELDEFKVLRKDYKFGRAKFYRGCWRFHTLKLYKYFEAKSEDDLLDRLGVDKIEKTTFREACRVYKQFLDRVKELPEYKGDDGGAKDYAEKLIDKTYTAVDANGSYLGELARTKVVGATKRETEENLEDVKKIYHDDKTKTIKDFTKSIKKKFGVINPEQSKRSAASQPARAAKRAADRADGDKFMVNMRFDATLQARVVMFLEGVSTSVGLRTKYADMNSDEIGTLFSVMMQRLEKGNEVPKGLDERKLYTLNRAREMVVGMTGVTFPDDILTGCVEDFAAIAEPLAEKL